VEWLEREVRHSTVEPRTVELRSPEPHWVSTRLNSPTPVPATLQTCQEPRNLGLYRRVVCELGRGGGGERCYVWFNLDIDMVSIGTVRFDSRRSNPLRR
jgi:hypothetical protein